MKWTKEGGRIKAGRVLARAVEVVSLPVTKGSSTHKIQRCRLRKHAFCLIERPMVLVRDAKKAQGFLREKGDSLQGERILARARRIDPRSAVSGSGGKILQRRLLEGTVFCVIERALKAKETRR